MNTLLVLALLLFVSMKWIGGDKGVRSYLALFLNFAVTFLAVMFMTIQSIDPLLITFIASMVISGINLFFINGYNQKSVIAFFSTLFTLVFLVIAIYLIVEKAMIQGFGEEEIEEVISFTLYLGTDFVKIAISTIIMGTIGAVTDTAISITSSMNELYLRYPQQDRYALFKSGMTVGKDILGTTTNTLFFAFIGGYLALIVWFEDLNYSFGEILNSKVFSSEMISIFFVGTGALLIIPVTASLTAYLLLQTKFRDRFIK